MSIIPVTSQTKTIQSYNDVNSNIATQYTKESRGQSAERHLALLLDILRVHSVAFRVLHLRQFARAYLAGLLGLTATVLATRKSTGVQSECTHRAGIQQRSEVHVATSLVCLL